MARSVLTVRADVRDPADAQRLVDETVRRFGGVDVLVNNAGVGRFANVADMSLDDWRQIIDTNLSGVFYCSRAAIPAMKARGAGFIINISSLAGKNAFTGGAAYCASKAGLNAFSEALMQEVRYDNIRVSYVMPGSVSTGFGDHGPSGEADWKLTPDDVARVVVDLIAHDPRSLPSRVETPAVPAAQELMSEMTSVAHYNLLERIGEGGIGELYRARDTKVGRTVALKLVSPAITGDPDRLRRLMQDARMMTVLSHPNIATLWDVGESDGQTYLAYEFAAGRSLLEEAGGRPMNPRRALDLAVQIADGVADAHSAGIIHGDLRPDTIIVTDKGNAKVLDFGLAPWTKGGMLRASAAKNPDALPPESSAVLGYLSPEQAIGSAVDPRTDVFSIGTLTYEMVTGKNPFVAPTAAATAHERDAGEVHARVGA